MPKVNPGESKDEYISRCIPYMIEKEGKDKDQAAAMCYSFWEQHTKNEGIIDKIDKYLKESVKSENILGFAARKMKSIFTKEQLQAKSKLDDDEFEDAWDALVDTGFIEPAGKDKYKWSE